ncbi:hypothetical protein F2P46_04185 [Massilia sp. CCM 8734]|nr:hypothetical protein [Massilia sp. CCM 8734]
MPPDLSAFATIFKTVIPAQAGIQGISDTRRSLDSRLRGNDGFVCSANIRLSRGGTQRSHAWAGWSCPMFHNG